MAASSFGPRVVAAATCHHPRGHVLLSPYGDVNASGTVNVADAICAISAALSVLAGEPLPPCVAPAWLAVGVDLNCDGVLSVADAQIIIAHAIGAPLGEPVDSTGDGCPDACAPCVPPGGSSCFILATCVPEGQLHATEPCQTCSPGESTNAWVTAPALTPCDEEGRICIDGACVDAVPGPPTAVEAVPGDGWATVSFSPPSFTGGSAISGYEVQVQPGGALVAGPASPIGVTDLANGVEYTFRVRATNSAGDSEWSAPSAPVTPLMCLGEPDGTLCDDGDACTQVDTCQSQVCSGADPVICTALGPCHAVGTCDSTSGVCSNPPLADGTACDDGSACTSGDACQAGICAGEYDCDPAAECVSGPGGDACSCPPGSIDALGDGTQCAFAANCYGVLQMGLGTTSGIYTIDPDGPGGNAPYPVYCNQSLSSGGWTLLYTSSDDGVATFTWNQRALLSTDTTLVGSPADPNRDFKSQALHDLPFERLLFIHQPSGVWAEYSVDSEGQSFGALVSSFPVPNCPLSADSGYKMVAGTLTAPATTPRLCDLDLYFNLGDRDGTFYGSNAVAECLNLNAQWNNTTYGPGWNIGNNDGCHFDDSSMGATGPSYPCPACASGQANIEENARGFGWARGLNTGASGAAENYIQVFAKSQQAQFGSCAAVRSADPALPPGYYVIDDPALTNPAPSLTVWCQTEGSWASCSEAAAAGASHDGYYVIGGQDAYCRFDVGGHHFRACMFRQTDQRLAFHCGGVSSERWLISDASGRAFEAWSASPMTWPASGGESTFSATWRQLEPEVSPTTSGVSTFCMSSRTYWSGSQNSSLGKFSFAQPGSSDSGTFQGCVTSLDSGQYFGGHSTSVGEFVYQAGSWSNIGSQPGVLTHTSFFFRD